MKIFVIGSGGREHALVWKFAQSPKVKKLYAAPGNGGISRLAECVSIDMTDIDALLDFAKEKKVDITVVGPEKPLALGIVDRFRAEGLRVFGPTKELAMVESSKVYAKRLMRRFGIPTADFEIFGNSQEAKDYVLRKGTPIVIKADGLAAGKGVIVAKDKQDATGAIANIMDFKIFGDSGNKVVIEDYLEGQEASILVVTDGKDFVTLLPSQDHKRIYDGDTGPNTGGMGAYAPAPVVDENMLTQITQKIIEPLIFGLAKEGKFYTGVLYAGLMLTEDGPKVLEFNVRFGDPEIQAILPLLKTDLVDIVDVTLDGSVGSLKLEWLSKVCVCVVISSGGYPGDYKTGFKIKGIDKLGSSEKIVVFHAGTRFVDGEFVTAGGRVLGISGIGDDIKDAIDITYKAVGKIEFEDAYYRKDIGAKALNIKKEQIPTHSFSKR